MAGPSSPPLSTVTEPIPRWWPWVRLALFLGLLAVCGLVVLPTLLGRPSYEIKGGQIIARGVLSRTVIPEGTPVSEEPVVIQSRQVGSAGPGYTVGRFRLERFGEADLYTDGAGRGLVFRTTPRVTVLAPASPEAFLRVWRSGGSGLFRPLQAPRPSLITTLPLLLVLPILVFLARQPRMTYRWEDDALVVTTALSRQRFPVGATRAALTTEGLGSRLIGTAVPGYYTGTFSMNSAGGGHVQAYATAARPEQALVFHLDGKAYYLTPEDPLAVLKRFQRA